MRRASRLRADRVRRPAPWLNEVPLVVAVVLHLAAIASETVLVEHRFRHWRVDVATGEPVNRED
jgi:hypothetical protein